MPTPFADFEAAAVVDGIVEVDTQSLVENAASTDVVVLPARLFTDLHRATNAHEVAAAILTHIGTVVAGDRHSVGIAADDDTIEVVHLDDEGALVGGTRFPRANSIVGRAFRSRRSALGVDYADRPEADAAMLWSKGLASGICHPVVHRDTVVATINVASRSTERYTEQDVVKLRALAELAGFHLAMRNRLNEAERLANVDPLTGTANRRAFADWLGERLDDQRWTPFALGILDLDHFKRINDTYGHTVGDRVLVAVAQCLQASVRDRDLVVRFGGEEFALLIDGADEAAAEQVFERVVERVRALEIQHVADPLVVTASLGATVRHTGDRTPAEIFERADGALYAAKSAGRDRLVMRP